METTTAVLQSSADAVRWRRLAADVLDAAVVTVAAGASGWLTYQLATPAPADRDGFATLGAALLAAGVSLVVAAVLGLGVLVATARGRSPGDRIVRRPGDGPGVGAAFARLGRWVALGAASIGVASVTSAAEPGVEGSLGPALGLAVAALATAVAAVDLTDRAVRRTALAAVLVAAGLGVAIGSLVPDRDPYDWEVRRAAEERLPATLQELGARPVCADVGVAAGPAASHGLAPCHDPDEVWSAAGGPAVVAERVASALEAADAHLTVERDTDVTSAGEPVVLLRVHDLAVVAVARTACGTRVHTDPPLGGLDADVFLPDVALADRCA